MSAGARGAARLQPAARRPAVCSSPCGTGRDGTPSPAPAPAAPPLVLQAWVNVTREAAEDETSPFILSLLARARAGLGAWFVRKAEAAPRTPQTLPERALARAGPAA